MEIWCSVTEKVGNVYDRQEAEKKNYTGLKKKKDTERIKENT